MTNLNINNLTTLPAAGSEVCLRNLVINPPSWQSIFSKLLLCRPDWQSNRCSLRWTVKKTSSGRPYPKLLVSKSAKDMLPTVLAIDGSRSGEQIDGRRKIRGNGQRYSSNLCDMARSLLLPTPTTREYKGGRHPNSLIKAGRSATNSLNDTINSVVGTCCKLNPVFIAEMMGFPVNWTLVPFQKINNKSCKTKSI